MSGAPTATRAYEAEEQLGFCSPVIRTRIAEMADPVAFLAGRIVNRLQTVSVAVDIGREGADYRLAALVSGRRASHGSRQARLDGRTPDRFEPGGSVTEVDRPSKAGPGVANKRSARAHLACKRRSCRVWCKSQAAILVLVPLVYGTPA